MTRARRGQDVAGIIVDANPAAEKILGLTLDQIQGRTSFDPHWKAIHEDGSAFAGNTRPSMVALQTGKQVRDVVMGVFHPDEEQHQRNVIRLKAQAWGLPLAISWLN